MTRSTVLNNEWDIFQNTDKSTRHHRIYPATTTEKSKQKHIFQKYYQILWEGRGHLLLWPIEESSQYSAQSQPVQTSMRFKPAKLMADIKESFPKIAIFHNEAEVDNNYEEKEDGLHELNRASRKRKFLSM
ncbi:hypothetical protein RF11_10040 [Thelohanellus kitauei]|uniref:Uncharacterized protein n=1 Tax=Thelohanellus kitauei TaxID=669202 RepID=A0A0C2MHU1_THEKT|nr:hypothetical protein RF11_10040 [Thelohanellus kitauei]